MRDEAKVLDALVARLSQAMTPSPYLMFPFCMAVICKGQRMPERELLSLGGLVTEVLMQVPRGQLGAIVLFRDISALHSRSGCWSLPRHLLRGCLHGIKSLAHLCFRGRSSCGWPFVRLRAGWANEPRLAETCFPPQPLGIQNVTYSKQ